MEKLLELIKNKYPHILSGNENLISDGVLDSIEVIGLIEEIETTFGIDIPIENIVPENFENIECLWKMINELLTI